MIISEGRSELDGKWRIRSSDIIMRWREQNEAGAWVRKEKIDTSFKPYGYVNPNKFFVCNGHEYDPLSYQQQKRYQVEEICEKDGTLDRKVDAVDSKGIPLWKVTFDSPTHQWWFRRRYSHDAIKYCDGTYELDVPYVDRYLIDNVEKIVSYKPRLLYIDLESTQFTSEESPRYPCLPGQEHRGHQEINTIGCYDNYSNTYVQWFQHPEIEQRMGSDTFDGQFVEIRYFSDEKTMLEDFVEWLDMIDPDMLLAWGMGFYDLPTLYTRLEATGVGAFKLSPSSLGHHQFVEPLNKNGEYGWTTQPIVGRIVISLDRLFERVYKDSTNSELQSKKLDRVGSLLFGRGKTEWRPDFWDKDYHKEEYNFLYYNYRDVALMKMIDDKYNVVDGQLALQELCGCSYVSTFYGSNFARVYFMRKADFKQRTGKRRRGEKSKDKAKGALVLDPEELKTYGINNNVAILDYSGLYPAMMVAYNTSWETRVLE